MRVLCNFCKLQLPGMQMFLNIQIVAIIIQKRRQSSTSISNTKLVGNLRKPSLPVINVDSQLLCLMKVIGVFALASGPEQRRFPVGPSGAQRHHQINLIAALLIIAAKKQYLQK